MVSVKVLRKSTGRPVKSARVAISFDGWTRGMSKTQYTDADGEAHFSNDPGNGTIYVNGSTVYKGKIQGMKHIYIR